jgi:hypothetical protein
MKFMTRNGSSPLGIERTFIDSQSMNLQDECLIFAPFEAVGVISREWDNQEQRVCVYARDGEVIAA